MSARTIAVGAFLVALVALAVSAASIVQWVSPEPLGVCVMLNDSFADTTVTATVEQARRINGVVTCEVGTYVPVKPR